MLLRPSACSEQMRLASVNLEDLQKGEFGVRMHKAGIACSQLSCRNSYSLCRVNFKAVALKLLDQSWIPDTSTTVEISIAHAIRNKSLIVLGASTVLPLHAFNPRRKPQWAEQMTDGPF